jgi:hypothetical protein
VPESTILIPHALDAEEAKQRVIHFAESAKNKTGWVSKIQSSWTDRVGQFSLEVFGMTVTGSVEIQPASAQVCLQYPFTALPFKRQIEQEIAEKGRELLA